MGALREILTRLPQLTALELEQVRLRLDVLGKKPQIEGEDWLLNGISVELRRQGLWTRPGVIPRNMLPPGYAEKAASARAYLTRGVSRNLRNNEQVALGALACAALVERLNRAKVPVTPGTVLRSLDQLGGALEEAFPSYWGSAALGVCLRLI